jgi:hypothetical protein
MTMPPSSRITALCLVLPLLVLSAAAATSTKNHSSHKAGTHKSSSAHASKNFSKSTKNYAKASKSHGQRTIAEDRTVAIQQALIREHYLNGEASGVWDQDSKQAMVRYQEANGWQSKVVPDSRALIKLGLGPDHKNLLNPDSAAVASPHELGATHETLPGGSAQP